MSEHRGRILVVDDVADWRDMVGDLLQDVGYEVSEAQDEESAMRLLHERPYHVAIVDLRLEERDEQNRAGLSLAERMKAYMPELAIIVLTGYADVASIKQALEPHGDGQSTAFAFVEKHDEITKLLSTIKLAFEMGVKINPGLNIRLPEGSTWQQISAGIACLGLLSSNRAQLEIIDVLQRLFHTADELDIRPLKNGHSGGAVLFAIPTINGIRQAGIIVKFDAPDQAKHEYENYRTYVDQFVGGARRTELFNFRSTEQLGGIAYSFVGTSAKAFRRFRHIYLDDAEGSVQIIKNAIKNLFCETCHPWYTNTLTATRRKTSLGAYTRWLRIDQVKLDSALSGLVGSSAGANLSFIDPRRPTRSSIRLHGHDMVLANPLLAYKKPFPYAGQFCFTHGDLHEDNILIDEHGQTWLIDFTHTGLSHPVRDFAMLESAMKFYLQQSVCPLADLYTWEQSLSTVTSFGEQPFPVLKLIPELQKAHTLILYLRSLVPQIMPQMTFRDYQIALYFHALKGMTLQTKFDDRQRQHALISAAILAEVLAEDV